MGISKVKMPESHERLMMALGETIRQHTMVSPMALEHIIGCLAFTTGAAIGRANGGRNERRVLRQMADANLDYGIEAVVGSSSAPGIILPERFN